MKKKMPPKHVNAKGIVAESRIKPADLEVTPDVKAAILAFLDPISVGVIGVKKRQELKGAIGQARRRQISSWPLWSRS